jgi:predicted PurR-regulated permease PerM
MFWIVTLVLVAMMVVLLRHVLLPFVAAMALAYLLDPLANRLERIGMNRAAATLLILGLFSIGVITLLMVAIPIIERRSQPSSKAFPYIKRVRRWSWINHPWISKIVGAGLSEVQ